jgi:RNA polymerase sigma-54 factor
MLLQKQKPLLRPQTTAHLAQTMALLELTTAELRQKVEAELARNPALELFDEYRCPTCHKVLYNNKPCPSCTSSLGSSPDQPIVYLSCHEDFFARSGSGSISDDLPDDNFAPDREELPAYILRQIGPELLIEDRPIAVHILTSINEDGFLTIKPMEIAMYHHVPLSRVEKIINLIQHADPIGVGSASPKEALLIQLEVLGETISIPSLAEKAISAGMELLSPHHLPELARHLNISTLQAKEIVRFISDNLNPFPGRAHWGDQTNAGTTDSEKNTFHFPDIIISRISDSDDSALVVEIAMPFYGTLRVNPLFREALQQAPSEKSELWQEDLEKATLLVKCLQQRNHTIVRLMQRLVVIQRDFILYGDAWLKPLTRADLAEELEVHESTMSRAVSDKAVQLPNRRIVPLSMFFDRSLHVRTALKQIIDQETSTLSDSQIAELLSGMGFPVARRTVAKYRSIEGILPAHLRSRAYKPHLMLPQHNEQSVAV